MKKIVIRILLAVITIFALAATLAGIEYFGGQPMGLFSGSRPASLGFSAGKFVPPPWKPNCVTSTVEKSDKHYIEPLAFTGAPADAWKKLQEIIATSPGTTVVSGGGNYLYAEFKSAGLGFVDDVEFALDNNAGLIQVRSASRLGVRDFNVNRKRIETIREKFSR